MSVPCPVVPLEARLSLTVGEAALLAGLPEKQVRLAVRSGDLVSFTCGSSTRRVRRADLEDWLRGLV